MAEISHLAHEIRSRLHDAERRPPPPPQTPDPDSFGSYSESEPESDRIRAGAGAGGALALTILIPEIDGASGELREHRLYFNCDPTLPVSWLLSEVMRQMDEQCEIVGLESPQPSSPAREPDSAAGGKYAHSGRVSLAPLDVDVGRVYRSGDTVYAVLSPRMRHSMAAMSSSPASRRSASPPRHRRHDPPASPPPPQLLLQPAPSDPYEGGEATAAHLVCSVLGLRHASVPRGCSVYATLQYGDAVLRTRPSAARYESKTATVPLDAHMCVEADGSPQTSLTVRVWAWVGDPAVADRLLGKAVVPLPTTPAPTTVLAHQWLSLQGAMRDEAVVKLSVACVRLTTLPALLGASGRLLDLVRSVAASAASLFRAVASGDREGAEAELEALRTEAGAGAADEADALVAFVELALRRAADAARAAAERQQEPPTPTSPTGNDDGGTASAMAAQLERSEEAVTKLVGVIRATRTKYDAQIATLKDHLARGKDAHATAAAEAAGTEAGLKAQVAALEAEVHESATTAASSSRTSSPRPSPRRSAADDASQAREEGSYHALQERLAGTAAKNQALERRVVELERALYDAGTADLEHQSEKKASDGKAVKLMEALRDVRSRYDARISELEVAVKIAQGREEAAVERASAVDLENRALQLAQAGMSAASVASASGSSAYLSTPGRSSAVSSVTSVSSPGRRPRRPPSPPSPRRRVRMQREAKAGDSEDESEDEPHGGRGDDGVQPWELQQQVDLLASMKGDLEDQLAGRAEALRAAEGRERLLGRELRALHHERSRSEEQLVVEEKIREADNEMSNSAITMLQVREAELLAQVASLRAASEKGAEAAAALRVAREAAGASETALRLAKDDVADLDLQVGALVEARDKWRAKVGPLEAANAELVAVAGARSRELTDAAESARALRTENAALRARAEQAERAGAEAEGLRRAQGTKATKYKGKYRQTIAIMDDMHEIIQAKEREQETALAAAVSKVRRCQEELLVATQSVAARAQAVEDIVAEMTLAKRRGESMESPEMVRLRRLVLSAFSEAMKRLKAEVMHVNPASMGWIANAASRCKSAPQAWTLFKAAHLRVKLIVLRLVGGKGLPRREIRWPLTDAAVASTPRASHAELLEQLAILVISVENLDLERFMQLGTSREIIHNVDWLIKLGHYAGAQHGARRRELRRNSRGLGDRRMAVTP